MKTIEQNISQYISQKKKWRWRVTENILKKICNWGFIIIIVVIFLSTNVLFPILNFF